MLCSETEEASMALAERLRAEDEEAQLQRQVRDAADAKFTIAMHKIEWYLLRSHSHPHPHSTGILISMKLLWLSNTVSRVPPNPGKLPITPLPFAACISMQLPCIGNHAAALY